MKVDAIQNLDVTANPYFLEQLGLNHLFSPSAVDNNSPQRALKVSASRNRNIYSMLDALQISKNKFLIIRLMRRGDMVGLLNWLEKDKLVEAMRFFPRSKLLQFIHYLPKRLLLKMLLWVMPLRALLQFFPTETIFNILRSKRLEVSDFVRGFANMPKEVLAKLMGEITGQNVDSMSHRELVAMFGQLRKEQIVEGMKSMGQKHLFEFIFQQVKRDPELLMTIPRGELQKVFALMPKPNLVELFRLVDEKILIMFLSQLPDKLLAMSAAQIDDATFAYLLINKYPDLVASLAGAA